MKILEIILITSLLLTVGCKVKHNGADNTIEKDINKSSTSNVLYTSLVEPRKLIVKDSEYDTTIAIDNFKLVKENDTISFNEAFEGLQLSKFCKTDEMIGKYYYQFKVSLDLQFSDLTAVEKTNECINEMETELFNILSNYHGGLATGHELTIVFFHEIKKR